MALERYSSKCKSHLEIYYAARELEERRHKLEEREKTKEAENVNA